MMAFIKCNKIFSLILAIAIICAALLIGARISEESTNQNVSMVMTYRDVFRYAEAAGIDEKEALGQFASVGIAGIIVENYWYFFPEKEINNIKDAGMEPILKTVRDITVEDYDSLIKKYDINYPLLFTYRYLVGDADEYLKENDIALVLVENNMQTGHEDIQHFDSTSSEVKMVRMFKLIKPFASRYAVLGYDGAEEIENLLYRAVSDRNIRLLWITPFYDSRTGEMITDIGEYREVFENLAERMKPHSQTLGREFSSVERYVPSSVLVLGCFFGICALSVLLFGTLFDLSPKLRLIFTLALSFVFSLVYFFARGLSLTIMAFAVVSVMPCLAVCFLLRFAKQLSKKRPNFGICLLLSFVAFFVTILMLVVGGSFAGAILSESRYMLEFEMFRGVKLSQLIPLVFTVVLLAKEFIYKKGKNVHSLVLELGQNASRSKKLILLFGFLVILGAVALFIVRTGDNIIQAGEIEQRFRIFFEVTCVARPRTKEFLIAWPALMLTMLLFSQNRKILGSVALFAASIGCASVCNTFCHIRAYYLLSVIRTAYGAVFGLVLGVVVVIVAYLFLRAVDTTKKS